MTIMEITCSQCNSKFKVAGEKIPADKTVNVSCPKCKEKIAISRPAPEDPAEKGGDYDFDFEYEEDGAEAESPFDFAEEEGKTALICETDPKIIDPIVKILEFMEFHITRVDNARDAIKKMRYNTYDLLIVNETFDSRDPDANGILIYLARLHMSVRRKMYVVMLTRRFRTMDNMLALNKSVNLIINLKNLDRFEDIIRRGLSDADIFYRIYNETLKNLKII